MKLEREILRYVIYIAIGMILFGLGAAEIVDEFWSGMGGGLLAVGILRMVRWLRFRKDEEYREKVETAIKDERNAFLRNKAWAWAGYLFVLVSGVLVIVLKVMGRELLSAAAAWAMCLMLIFYWGSYLVLKRKY